MTTETISVCGGEISYLRQGSGDPLLVLPRDNGHAPDTAFIDRLAEQFTVYYPWLPGFHGGRPEQWAWLFNVRDLAVVMGQFCVALGLQRTHMLGLGFGGWLSAELATMNPGLVDRLALVGPMGVQPASDFICDQFVIGSEAYARTAFANQAAFEAIYSAEPGFEQLESWETDREMASRLAWKPYMYNPTLPRLLGGVTSRALIVWGEADRVVPVECGDLYLAALPNATLERLPGAGHAVDLEQPDTLASTITAFLQKPQV